MVKLTSQGGPAADASVGVKAFFGNVLRTSSGRSFVKWGKKRGKPRIIAKFPPFLKGNPAEHQYLTIFKC